MELFDIFSILMVMAAVFAYLNNRYLKLPSTIGLMILSMGVSVCLVLLSKVGLLQLDWMRGLIRGADFGNLLMKAMLSFLLFAGAIHMNGKALRSRIVPVLTLATVGVLISTALVGLLMWGLFQLTHLEVPLALCLVFGALISPTDPVAVIGILKDAHIPKDLEVKISGESLLNDGVAVVAFTTLVNYAMTPESRLTLTGVTLDFLQEGVGGLILGAMLGLLASIMMRRTDNYKVEVLITLAVVMGGYGLAGYLHVSGPLAMVVAGLVTSEKGFNQGASADHDYLDKFWELLDEVLNALLFLLIGLEMIVLRQGWLMPLLGLGAFAITVVSRFASVALPLTLLKRRYRFGKGTRRIMTWGGLRGGVSVALALSLPDAMPYREDIILITYVVVVISIIVQGLTVGKVAKRITARYAKPSSLKPSAA